MKQAPRIFFVVLAVATGALFLFSAYTKLFPTIQAFEYNLAAQAHLHYMTAALASRFFIVLEAGLGSLIVIHYFGRNNWVLLADDPFDKYTGGEYPQIMWVNNGLVEANTTYPELDQKVIERWMK